MTRQTHQDTSERRRPKRLNLTAAVPFWFVASVAGWAIVASLFIFGIGQDNTPQIADRENLQTILEFAPAAGPKSGKTDPVTK